jgi:hypothetical protein
MNENTMCGTTEAQLEKHLGIHNAIHDVNSVIRSLDELLSRIQGPQPPAPCAPVAGSAELKVRVEPDQPTLSALLNGAEGDIRAKTDKAHHLIGKIRDELF